jgi:DNA polymerase I-like protein with 3'-5' exonuclease and polymerase domains
LILKNRNNNELYLKFYKNFKSLEEFKSVPGFWNVYKRNLTKYAPLVKQYFKLKGKIERLAKNGPIQGTGADMIKLASCMIKEEFDFKKLNAFIVLTQHDEILCECDKDIAKECAEIVKRNMEKAGKGNAVLDLKRE